MRRTIFGLSGKLILRLDGVSPWILCTLPESIPAFPATRNWSLRRNYGVEDKSRMSGFWSTSIRERPPVWLSSACPQYYHRCTHKFGRLLFERRGGRASCANSRQRFSFLTRTTVIWAAGHVAQFTERQKRGCRRTPVLAYTCLQALVENRQRFQSAPGNGSYRGIDCPSFSQSVRLLSCSVASSFQWPVG